MTQVEVTQFERRYRDEADPWAFATSEYEQRKYDLTVASLPRRRYRAAFEPGCSIGELTRRLASRCDAVIALDASPTAAARAAVRCAELGNVEVLTGEVPRDWPLATFDLVVLSEIGYYFDVHSLRQLGRKAVSTLEVGGTLLAVHWRGTSADHLLHGDQVHRVLGCDERLRAEVHHDEPGFVLDAWVRT
jgi:cyclopropane fatty-acyl-phospholipid synthase-like methyltransferase